MNTLSVAQGTLPPGSEASQNLAVAEESPCLVNIPATPTPMQAMGAMARLGKMVNGADTAPSIEDLEHILIPTHEHAQILIDVVSQIRESYDSRNLRDAEYRLYTLSANELLHRAFDRHGHRLPAKGGMAPGAKSRGIFVCAAAQMGRQRLADEVESFIGRGVRRIRVPISDQHIDFLQLKTLRVNWPEKGNLLGFARAFIAAFDSAMSTTYSTRTRGPLFRHADIVSSLCALSTVSNLGLLIVERINSRAATTHDADEMWDALGIFTRTTGIPVLCLATPGGSLGLVAQSGSIGDLAHNGLHCLNVPSADSPNWIAASKKYFKSSLALAGVEKTPLWFVDSLWELSQGHYGLAVKACGFVARHMISLCIREISEASFIELAQKSLLLESSHLQAVKLAGGGGVFKTASLRRHGDWIPLQYMLQTMPTLALEDSPIAVSGD